MTQASVGIAVAFAVTLASQPLLISLLEKHRLIDLPNERSSHVAPTPRGAGIGASLGVLVGAALTTGGLVTDMTVIVTLALILAAVGWVDDVRGLPAYQRLGVQLTVGGLAGFIFLPDGTWWGLPVVGAALWVAAYTNAFNFMDGINGISGLNACLTGVSFAVIGLVHEQSTLATAGGLIAATGLGFLPHNLLLRRIFLGDVGSYLYGGLISVTLVFGLKVGIPAMLLIAPLVIYLTDTGATIALRAVRRQALTEAHRSHAYQRLSDQWGHSVAAVWSVALAAVAVTGSWIGVTESRMAGVSLMGGAALLYWSSPWLATPPVLRLPGAGRAAQSPTSSTFRFRG